MWRVRTHANWRWLFRGASTYVSWLDETPFWSATTEEIMESIRLAVLRIDSITDAWWHTGPNEPGPPPLSYEVVLDGGDTA
ncbi:MAG TPA: hypothetical protein VJP45_08005 [Candidatus Limnocylindria bacterium]|nr:hypothetical protein [Candidatus Limnocylindria bacterium]